MSLTLSFHGAARTVTGSCLDFRSQRGRILIDCGLFQGPRSLEALNHEPLGFDPKTIDAVVLTHAHIDHSGLLPRLAAEGFSGPIWCTPETTDLIEFMLAGATAVQIGTQNFVDPFVWGKVLDGLTDYLVRHKVGRIDDLVGSFDTTPPRPVHA